MYVKQTNGKIESFEVNTVKQVTFVEEKEPEIGVSVSGTVGDYTYVDLGLPSGLKWATHNVGAKIPTQAGNFYAWGEVEAKKSYSWSNYKFCTVKENGEIDTFTKYNVNIEFGEIDYKKVLDPEDDVATVIWGNEWRMPTSEEQLELIEGCTWEWTTNFKGSGVPGTVGTSIANGNTIFLPANGEYNEEGHCFTSHSGAYWASTNDEIFSFQAPSLSIGEDYMEWRFRRERLSGLNIRAVVK